MISALVSAVFMLGGMLIGLSGYVDGDLFRLVVGGVCMGGGFLLLRKGARE